jgi:hypothetical protein
MFKYKSVQLEIVVLIVVKTTYSCCIMLRSTPRFRKSSLPYMLFSKTFLCIFLS